MVSLLTKLHKSIHHIIRYFIFDRMDVQSLYFDSINWIGEKKKEKQTDPLLELTSFLFEGSEQSGINLTSFNDWRYSSAKKKNLQLLFKFSYLHKIAQNKN